MILTFSWRLETGEFAPYCGTQLIDMEQQGPLACLLMEEVASGDDTSLAWLREGIARVEAVASGALPSAEWGCSAWGASIERDIVSVASLHVDSCTESVSPASFRRALVEWLAFIQSPPDRTLQHRVPLCA
jgi:hypothetical protein